MTDDEEAMFNAACQAVGEIIVTANLIDAQLNKALIGVFVLPDHPMIEPIVAQLDIRPKVELLKKRFTYLPAGNEWREHCTAWLKQVEKVNDHRNMVAHHRIGIKNGKVELGTGQLSKIMASIDSTMRAKPVKGLSDIKQWAAEALLVLERGMTILRNLDSFRAEAIRRDLLKKRSE